MRMGKIGLTRTGAGDTDIWPCPTSDKRRLWLRHQQAAYTDDYNYDDGRGLPTLFDILRGEEPPDTSGGRFFFLDATSGLPATRRFGAGPVPLCALLVWCKCKLWGMLKTKMWRRHVQGWSSRPPLYKGQYTSSYTQQVPNLQVLSSLHQALVCLHAGDLIYALYQSGRSPSI